MQHAFSSPLNQSYHPGGYPFDGYASRSPSSAFPTTPVSTWIEVRPPVPHTAPQLGYRPPPPALPVALGGPFPPFSPSLASPGAYFGQTHHYQPFSPPPYAPLPTRPHPSPISVRSNSYTAVSETASDVLSNEYSEAGPSSINSSVTSVEDVSRIATPPAPLSASKASKRATPGKGKGRASAPATPAEPSFVPVDPNSLKIVLDSHPWEDEDTWCWFLNVGEYTICRRQDNDMVNGTKLFNSCALSQRFSRGRRDGPLKNERIRHVVKNGSKALQGIWIPLSSARSIAEKYNLLPYVSRLLQDEPAPRHHTTRAAHQAHLDAMAAEYEAEAGVEEYEDAGTPPPPHIACSMSAFQSGSTVFSPTSSTRSYDEMASFPLQPMTPTGPLRHELGRSRACAGQWAPRPHAGDPLRLSLPSPAVPTRYSSLSHITTDCPPLLYPPSPGQTAWTVPMASTSLYAQAPLYDGYRYHAVEPSPPPPLAHPRPQSAIGATFGKRLLYDEGDEEGEDGPEEGTPMKRRRIQCVSPLTSTF